MAQVVGIGPPRHFEIWEYVIAIRGKQRLARGLNIRSAAGCDIGIFLAIEAHQSGRDLLRCFVIALIGGFYQCSALSS